MWWQIFKVKLSLSYLSVLVLAVSVSLSEIDCLSCVSLLALWPPMTCFSAFRLLHDGINSRLPEQEWAVQGIRIKYFGQKYTLKINDCKSKPLCIREHFRGFTEVSGLGLVVKRSFQLDERRLFTRSREITNVTGSPNFRSVELQSPAVRNQRRKTKIISAVILEDCFVVWNGLCD